MNAGWTLTQTLHEGKIFILQDLYKDYDLNSLLDEYPETRVRFFMMTCFKESSAELYNEFKTLIKDLRRRDISPWNLQERDVRYST